MKQDVWSKVLSGILKTRLRLLTAYQQPARCSLLCIGSDNSEAYISMQDKYFYKTKMQSTPYIVDALFHISS